MGFILKRICDITFSAAILILLAPLMLLLAVAVSFETKGNWLFRQERIGQGGKTFIIYKFRTMKVEQPKNALYYTVKGDPRITKIGKWLRLSSLDELPQIFNVLKGEMSLVGPRPDVPEQFKKYKGNELKRLSVLPGITGLAQVKQRLYGLANDDERLEWDLDYAEKHSFWVDLRILALTIIAVIKGKGAN